MRELHRMTFSILGRPTAKQAPGFGTGPNGESIVYQRGETKAYEKLVREEFVANADFRDAPEEVLPFAQFTGPVEVDIILYRGIPSSWPKWKANSAISGEISPTMKPDVDNLAKSICDGLKGVAFRDDKQISYLTVMKQWAPVEWAVKISIGYLEGKGV